MYGTVLAGETYSASINIQGFRDLEDSGQQCDSFEKLVKGAPRKKDK